MKNATDYVDYNDDRHEYRRKDSGKLLAGVSTVSGQLPKPYLLQWAANEAAYHWHESIDPGRSYNEEELMAICMDAKKAHTKKRDTAAVIGTNIHAIIEKYIQSGTFVPTHDSMIDEAMAQFIKWELDNRVKWFHTELLVCDLEHDVAGRLDALATIDGTPALIDFKTSNSLSDSYNIQTAGYCVCLDWMECKPVKERVLIRIPKTAERKVYNRSTRQYDIVRNQLEMKTVATDLKFDKEVFLHLREVYRWMNQDKLKQD